MNSKNYPAYVASKKKSEQSEQQNAEETVVNISNYTEIEIINENGKVVGVIDITRYNGTARFS